MLLGVVSSCAGGGSDIAGELEPVAAGARIAIERVTRLVCADSSGVAVDCDDVIGWVGADDRDDVDDGMDAATGGAGGIVGRVVCLVGIG